MKNKLLVVCGPTTTGKTSLALNLAKKFNGELVSADSRQVYKRMDIGTGKDIPKGFEIRNSNFEFQGGGVCYYTDEDTRIWGYDLVEPTEEFSVAQYKRVARKIIRDICKRKKLSILVGGTGLYIKAVVDGIPLSAIPRNSKLRKSLKDKKIDELFEILLVDDPVKAASMNISDRRNPRRVIRSIEVAKYKKENPGTRDKPDSGNKYNSLFIGLNAPKKIIEGRIEERVRKRLNDGLLEEIKRLLESGVSWDDQSMQALGYRQWKEYFEKHAGVVEREKDNTKVLGGVGGSEFKKTVEKWKTAEKQYAKRQMTWFKRDKRINWFDISKKNWQKKVEKLTWEWYSTNRNESPKN